MKFKRRKAAAQTKLENEKQNLVRVNDILSELEKQVGPLEKQSEVAKVYLRKKEELKTLDINVFLLENKKLREQLSSMEEKYNLASNELNETSEKYEGIKEEYERIQQEIESLDAAIEAAREQLTDTVPSGSAVSSSASGSPGFTSSLLADSSEVSSTEIPSYRKRSSRISLTRFRRTLA